MASRTQKIPQFQLERTFAKAGFMDKLAVFELPEGAAQAETYNFQIDEQGKWARRWGTKFFGTKSSDTGGCRNATTLIRRDGIEIPLVQYGAKLKYFHPDLKDWCVLLTGLSATATMGFAPSDEFSDNTNVIVFSNGVDAYQYWNGATGKVASSTLATIVFNTTHTLAELGFTATGSVVAPDGTQYAYTGIAGQTFTGVTPDASALAIGTAMASLPVVPNAALTYKGSVLAATQYGRIAMGNVVKTGTLSGNGAIFISAVDSYKDFSFSTPRVTGEGAIVNAPNGGGSVHGIAPWEDGFVVAKERAIYKLSVQDGTTIPFQLGILVPHEGAISPLCFFESENTVNYVTADFTISSLRRVAQYDQFAHPLPISDPIKNTVDGLIFDTTTAGKFYDGVDFYSMKFTAVSPVNDRILSFNNRYSVWDSPWVGLSAAAFFIYGSDLYMCDAATPDVYQIGSESVHIYNDFMTKDDPGFSVPGTLFLRNNNFGAPAIKKEFTEYWVEGEMFLSDSITLTAIFNNGARSVSGVLTGTQAGLLYTPVRGFGSEDSGVDTFGEGSQGSQDTTKPIRFRLIVTSEIQAFYEMALKIDCTGYFRLISHGPKLTPSTEIPDDSIYQALS